MAFKLNKFYDKYLRDCKAGTLAVPLWNEEETNEIFYGEVFCRIENCGSCKTQFSTTNNLRHHLAKYHKDYIFARVSGGRVSHEARTKANRFYESLYVQDESSSSSSDDNDNDENEGSPVDDEDDETCSEKSSSPECALTPGPGPSSPPSVTSEEDNLPLPMLEDGTVNHKAVRRVALDQGQRIPCKSCRKAKKDCAQTNNFLM
ncbi:uncharacterized protein ASPGLDRAFT_40541 [Aspergillus glaucus CBS 516.65]|uniref:C2H2-type domain-containing protein n=1 Tax=Aspergillus glaucus CBS 516.65 TaxID=1160497 RepID=A0A1L9V499_ASPGL|nr:hypothetical protein ASPGLDRAFT_40541 [Aspergillus glaucus CBS 516.65]OJJ78764.1 hypothetical protein ASPGLDRAFT_40541 [Aspergillus glaucus CBS 516.65]